MLAVLYFSFVIIIPINSIVTNSNGSDQPAQYDDSGYNWGDMCSWYMVGITPRNRVVLGKPTVTQFVREFQAFCGAQGFIAISVGACCWSMSCATCIWSTTSHPSSLGSILILSSQFCLDFQVVSSLWVFCQTFFVHFLFLPHAACIAHLHSFDHPGNVWWSVQVLKLLIMQSSPATSWGQIYSSSLWC